MSPTAPTLRGVCPSKPSTRAIASLRVCVSPLAREKGCKACWAVEETTQIQLKAIRSSTMSVIEVKSAAELETHTAKGGSFGGAKPCIIDFSASW